MTEATICGLRKAGCSGEMIACYDALERAGDTRGCLELLQRHRCELVCALHEAQRPIDVCDWMMYALEKESKHGNR